MTKHQYFISRSNTFIIHLIFSLIFNTSSQPQTDISHHPDTDIYSVTNVMSETLNLNI